MRYYPSWVPNYPSLQDCWLPIWRSSQHFEDHVPFAPIAIIIAITTATAIGWLQAGPFALHHDDVHSLCTDSLRYQYAHLGNHRKHMLALPKRVTKTIVSSPSQFGLSNFSFHLRLVLFTAARRGRTLVHN